MAKARDPKSSALDVSKLVAEMSQTRVRGRSRRSRLYLWFRENHDRLETEFARNSPSWDRLAEILAENGLTNGDGAPPSGAGARTVWYRVRREIAEAARQTGRAGDYPSGVSPVVPVAPAEQPADRAMTPPVNVEIDPPEDRPRFRLATLRGMENAPAPEPAKPAPAPVASQPNPNVDDVLADFLGRPSPGGFRPKSTQGEP
jgi:hypothetical protein